MADTEHDLPDPDSLPDSSDPNGPCPRCGRVANFEIYGSHSVTFDKGGYAVGPAGHERIDRERVSVLECSGCHDRIVVIEALLPGAGVVRWRGFHWWPPPGGGNLGTAVPAAVAAAYGEGMRCLSANGPNGAVAMFRTAMSLIVDEKGSTRRPREISRRRSSRWSLREGSRVR